MSEQEPFFEEIDPNRPIRPRDDIPGPNPAGNLSLVMAGLGIFCFIIAMAMASNMRRSYFGGVPDGFSSVMMFGLMFMVGTFVGLGAGIGGLMMENKKKTTAILGVVLCSIMSLLILLGVVAQMSNMR